MKKIFATSIRTVSLAGLLLAGLGNAALADKHGAQPASPAAAAPAQAAAMADGEVRRVDKSTGKITLKHGEIKSLDMPPMTMVFRVSDPAMLDKVQPGDKVRFSAEEIKGNITVTAIEAAK